MKVVKQDMKNLNCLLADLYICIYIFRENCINKGRHIEINILLSENVHSLIE